METMTRQQQNEARPRRPIVRYFGGKWLLAPWIISFFPAHRCYVEPFGGGGSVLLRKPRVHSEVYNDLDERMVNLFRVLRDPELGEKLKRRLELTPYSRKEFEATYVEPWPEDPVERAAYTVIRSQLGFGSNALSGGTGFRGNAKSNHRSPQNDWRCFPEGVDALIGRLKGVCIECRDYQEVTHMHDAADTLFYLDPPYPMSVRGRDAELQGKKLRYQFDWDTDEEHIKFAKLVHSLEGFVIVSGYECPLYEKLFGGWRMERRATHADGGRDRTECLWISPNCPEGQLPLL